MCLKTYEQEFDFVAFSRISEYGVALNSCMHRFKCWKKIIKKTSKNIAEYTKKKFLFKGMCLKNICVSVMHKQFLTCF